MKIGLFYGSSTCYTEIVAEKIQQQLQQCLIELTQTEVHIEVFNVKNTPLTQSIHHDVLIFGLSTWDYGEIQEDWAEIWQTLQQPLFFNKPIALFGLGDQEGYGEWFLDAMGLLHDALQVQQPIMLGYWPIDGYQFINSKALTQKQSHFVGLALDEDTQYDLSDARIIQWCQQVANELMLINTKDANI